MDDWWVILVAVAIVAAVVWGVRSSRRAARSRKRDALRYGHGNTAQKRQEALFKATFPELQPLFHPANVLEFVEAWRARGPNPSSVEWQRPPGLSAARARLSLGEKGEAVELFDPAGAVLARFRLQQHPDGGVLRLDPGKFTIQVRDAAVRYWHPEREFKWSRAKGWRLITRLSDQPIESSDRGIESSRESSSSSSSSAATTAAVIAGAGGAFAGAGASAKWDEGADSPAGAQSDSGATLAADAVGLAAAGAATETGSETSSSGSETGSSGTAY